MKKTGKYPFFVTLVTLCNAPRPLQIIATAPQIYSNGSTDLLQLLRDFIASAPEHLIPSSIPNRDVG